MSNEVFIQDSNQSVLTNATITSNGSATLTGYGFQQINLVINIKASPTGTTPTLTFTIQELDPGDKSTSIGNSTTTSALNAIGVTTATLNTSTSGTVKVSWTIAGASASFTQVYATVVAKATPSTQQTTSVSTTSTTGQVIGIVALGGGTTGTLNAIRATTYNEQSSNAQRSISSANTNDTNSAGTGARQVTITYYDASGNGPFTETISLNGTTAVNTVSSTICFIEKMIVTSVGSGGVNAGVITLFTTTGGGGTAIGTIGVGNVVASVGDNRTFWAHHYVPNGKTASFFTFICAANTNSGANFIMKSKTIGSATAPESQVSEVLVVSNYSIIRSLAIPIKVTGPARIVAYGIPGANSLVLTSSFDFSEQ